MRRWTMAFIIIIYFWGEIGAMILIVFSPNRLQIIKNHSKAEFVHNNCILLA